MSDMSSQERTRLRLDTLLQSARDHEVSNSGAAACVAGVQEWSALHRRRQRRDRSQRWLWAFGGGLTAAVILFLVSPWNSQSDRAPLAGESTAASALAQGSASSAREAPLQVGQRVALVASEGSRYVVLAASAERTEIAIEAGAVTARLYASAAHDHELILRAKDLEVRATGTTFSVGVDASGAPYSFVHEGSVAARSGPRAIRLQAGQGFPSSAPARQDLGASARALATLDLASVTPAAPDVPPEPEDPDEAGQTGERQPASASPIELWRQARALRSTGRIRQAIASLSELIASGDATWAPLAQLELARLYDSDLSQPAKALKHAKTFLRGHATHELAPEARKLACQALAQLGRSDSALCSARE